MALKSITKTDPELAKLIKLEEKRQKTTLNLIPSENFTSESIREAVGSVLMHKYSEGNIGKRYYEGNENIDAIETLAIERTKKVFNLPSDWTANMQALSGSNANLAVYFAMLEPGDTIMGMFLPDGGHLSHGWSYDATAAGSKSERVYLGGSRKVNVTSKFFRTIQYKTDPNTQEFDYAEIEKIAKEYRPKLLISGGTAYPRHIDYKRMKEIAQSVGAYYLADIAHEAGLVAAGVIPSPVGIADIVTMTTHKTFRGARGAIILSSEEIINKVNRSILPGLQGGPFNNNIAGICAALGEILKPNFKKYAQKVLDNANELALQLKKQGFTLVTGGTSKHLLLIDLRDKKIYGKKFARALSLAGIVANMNTLPGETRAPADPSAVRLGTPFVTTQGMGKKEMYSIASFIYRVYQIAKNYADLSFTDFQKKLAGDKQIKQVRKEVKTLVVKFA